MNIITLDFETYFDQDYSLSKLTTEAYVRDPRFEVHGCAIRLAAGTGSYCEFIRHKQSFVEYLTGPNCVFLAHHAHFDGLILSHHYGIRPAAWLDTLSMARMMLGNHVSVSLDSVRKHFGMPLKSTPYDLFKGKHWAELDGSVQRQIATGACDEVESIWQIFNRLMGCEIPA